MAATTANNNNANADAKVWLITGCSSGLGRQLAIAARSRGDLVIATARKIETLKDLQDLGCQALALDVTADDAVVNDIVAKAHALYGRIDILVNNAGYAMYGTVEEASAQEIQAAFDTNVFGLLRVTRAVLPYLREKRAGTIANIGSSAGYVPFAACGLYSATKFAVAGVTQSLRQEVEGLGIKVTVIEPGMFRTSIAANGSFFQKSIDDYKPLTDFFKTLVENSPNVAADPVKGAQAIVEALTQTGRAADRPLPNRLPLGGDVFDLVQGVLTTGQKELNEWKDFTDPAAFAFDA
ncbi:hypothetical protein Poli38472_014044 [Pythium oligandrum]|uniref:Uncharacterized protein n=1 Tax=Pythium oligandrum TaxID=41045 RepID=A0A8K1CQ98_PYTOL|nr:hypothetical protein Poli38472_014043 [Pythium oligandrum]TMW66732.1 hypothetical protein Poli38472_014044 [Pythium oligandrum]|eukprot:TMW66731.1 hypothetical protein Poli38472_014043 [Pythium oligandrum]